MTSVSWTAGAGDWATGANWSIGQPPAASDDATIGAVANPGVTISISTAAKAQSLSSRAVLSIYGSLAVAGGFSSSYLTSIYGSMTAGSLGVDPQFSLYGALTDNSPVVFSTSQSSTPINLYGGALTATSITLTPPTVGGHSPPTYPHFYGYGTVTADMSSSSGFRVEANGGALVLNGPTAGIARVDANSRLELGGASSRSVVFNGTSAALQLDSPLTFSGSVANVAVNGVIDLRSIVATAVSYTASTLTVTYGAGESHSYPVTLVPGNHGALVFGDDGAGGTNISWRLPATPDVNGDHTSDVVLQRDGRVVQWTIRDGIYQSGDVLTNNTEAYLVVGKGDFNGDGTTDLLEQNGGYIKLLTLENGSLLASSLITAEAGAFKVVAVGDFNGDGTSDVILQSGDTVVEWIMNNGAYKSGSVISTTAAGFKVIAAGDFNGDGTSDLVLQNGNTVVEWFMQAGAYQSGRVVSGSAAGFQVVAAGDFNGDGTSDLVLQHPSSHTVIDWILNPSSGALQSQNVISVGDPSNYFEVVGTGDYNGDGTSDLILQNTGGKVVDWIMLAGQYSTGHVISTNDMAFFVR